MAYIKHYWRRQRVLEECVDRGTKFQEWVERDVEHYCCSACGSETAKGNSFCPHCGVKLSGHVKEQYKNSSCVICGEKFKQLEHKNEEFCFRCRDLFMDKNRTEIAKAFYELGKKNGGSSK